jgi:RNA polymerase sigma factor (sigma-70 family)
MELSENRALLERFRKGEKAALEVVYRAYAPAVAAFLRKGFSFKSGVRTCRFLGSRTEFDLEDRVHDTFSRAFQEGARLGYDGLTPYKTYLFTIARNLVIDDLRRKERALVEYTFEDHADAPATPAGEATEPLHGTLEPSGDPLRDNEAAQLLGLVADFKGNLEAREREVYELRFEQALEHQEIAARTGISSSKIKTSEQRIRERFFQFMQKNGYFTGYVQERRGWLRALGA